jgi:hypothetical protein
VPKRIKVTFEPKAEENLRKLARAVIALVEQSSEDEQCPDELPEVEAS